MPRRDDVKKVLIIGSGPIVIGQACEFDYSGTQACKALHHLGYEVVLVNSNPATIMTDPQMADITYIEPLDLNTLTEIIAKERPDALLPNLGGQTGLNLSSQLYKAGVLDKYNVKVLGVNIDAIERGEDRTAFKNTMLNLGIEMPKSETVNSVQEARRVAEEIGFPLVIRPAYTMGGTGGGFAHNMEELEALAARGLAASMAQQILVEESVAGWEELELEVVRDAKNQMITVCFIENVDPMGVHTGDSFCTAPMLTIDKQTQQRLQDHAYRVVEAIEVIGGTNVQFAHNPQTGRIVIIEINPRTSRSSALASKATGFPIAYVSALLAGGLTLDELPYWKEGTLEKYKPSGDYVVVKFARWAFEKFRGVEDKLGTQMRAIGEVMSIGKTYKEALHKAIRSLENGRYGLGFAKDFYQKPLAELLEMLKTPTSERQFLLYAALYKGAAVQRLHEITKIKAWFLEQMKELVDLEHKILSHKGQKLPDDLLRRAKLDGFSDRYLSKLLGLPEDSIRRQRSSLNLTEAWEPVPVSAVDGAAYYFSSYNIANQVQVSDRRKIMVLGGGPNRIGQGIEFDYCCCHAAMELKELGFESIMVNCNPETVSTDYDTSDKLYFEPLTVEDVLSIYEHEKPEGVIVQFGGQTPLNIAAQLEAAGVKILGTSPDAIDLAEDRDRFNQVMRKLGIPQPDSGMASNLKEALEIAQRIGYPLIVRPSYVLGGRAMEIVYDQDMLSRYVELAVDVSPERPILIDKFLEHALEVEADALCDGQEAFVPGVMEHIEEAGIHSGDSACVLPPVSVSRRHLETIYNHTKRIALELEVKGLINIQYAIYNDTVYILEANPRASRTVPLVSKVYNLSMAKVATRLIMGQKLKDLNLKDRHVPYFGVKEAVFPFYMFPEVDPVLGPEMRSTGEVLGLADRFGYAFFKSQLAAQMTLPTEGKVLFTIADHDKAASLESARLFIEMGFQIVATYGTHQYYQDHGIECQPVRKISQESAELLDMIKNNEVQLVINSPKTMTSKEDGSLIRRTAVKHKVPYITTLSAAIAAAKGIKEARKAKDKVLSLQEYHSRIS